MRKLLSDVARLQKEAGGSVHDRLAHHSEIDEVGLKERLEAVASEFVELLDASTPSNPTWRENMHVELQTYLSMAAPEREEFEPERAALALCRLMSNCAAIALEVGIPLDMTWQELLDAHWAQREPDLSGMERTITRAQWAVNHVQQVLPFMLEEIGS